MMLRSSSTPLLSSLLPSAAFAESPNHHQPPSAAAADDHRLSFPSPSPLPHLHVGFRRVQSEGNLAAPPRRSAAILETIPVDAEDPGEGDVDEDDIEGGFDDDGMVAMCCGRGGSEAPLFLARGLGIDDTSGFSRLGGGGYAGGDGGGGGGGGHPTVTGYGGGRSDLEGFLKKMVEEHPSEALFLRNYAQFLYKEKNDVWKAEEYYSRAILASPGDGEILMEYAKLIWAHHGDRERAGQYFEQAVQASPHDCHVLAEHAHFLWAECEEEGDDPCDAYGGQALPIGAVAEAPA